MAIYSSYDISVADTQSQLKAIADRMKATQNKERKGVIIMPQQALTEAVFYILLSLQKPLHGYGIIQNVDNAVGETPTFDIAIS